MSKLDPDALTAVLEFIEANPDKWCQVAWESGCRTKFCFAGWACVMAGDVPTEEEVKEGEEHFGGLPWRENAVEILGLTHWEASALFNSLNGLSDLRRNVDQIIADHARV